MASESALTADTGGSPNNEAAASDKTASAEMEAREELLEETAANNEGMAGDKSNELPKAAAAGE